MSKCHIVGNHMLRLIFANNIVMVHTFHNVTVLGRRVPWFVCSSFVVKQPEASVDFNSSRLLFYFRPQTEFTSNLFSL